MPANVLPLTGGLDIDLHRNPGGPIVSGLWTCDFVDRRLSFPASLADVFGLARGGTADTRPPGLDFRTHVHAEDRDRVASVVAHAMEEGGSFVAEYRVDAGLARTRWILERGSFELDRRRKLQRGHGLLIDITAAAVSEEGFGLDVPSAATHPLVRAAGHLIAAHRELARTGERGAQRTADLLLFEIGSALARLGAPGP
ncbi:PAS domain-containing protein [Methylobacterium sp. A54F]